MLSRNVRRRERKKLERWARKKRQEEAKELRKVTLRSEASVRDSLERLFKQLCTYTTGSTVPIDVPRSTREKIHPRHRDFADRYWGQLLKGALLAAHKSGVEYDVV